MPRSTFRKPVEEDAVLEAYQLEIDNGQYQTENRVSHILFEARDGEMTLTHAAAGSSMRRRGWPAGAEFADVGGRVLR